MFLPTLLVFFPNGWSLMASDGTEILRLANGTTLRPRGHLLLAMYSYLRGYSLPRYASADAFYDFDIPDEGGIALFRTSNAENFTLDNRMDAVGFNSVTNALFREGAGLVPIGNSDGEYSFVRKISNGLSQDTNDNAADFVFVSTSGGMFGAIRAILGAPGPQNSGMVYASGLVASPMARTDVARSLIEPSNSATAEPNAVRCLTCLGPNAPLGTLIEGTAFPTDGTSTTPAWLEIVTRLFRPISGTKLSI